MPPQQSPHPGERDRRYRQLPKGQPPEVGREYLIRSPGRGVFLARVVTLDRRAAIVELGPGQRCRAPDCAEGDRTAIFLDECDLEEGQP